MPEGMGATVSCAETGALCGFAKSALDAAAGHRGGGAGQVLVIASGSGKEPGVVAVRLPGGAYQVEGVIGQGDGAVLRALATVHRPHVARAVDVTHLQGESFVAAQSTAVEGGEGGAMVQGRHGLEEALDLCAAENGREALCGLSSHDLQGFPVAVQDLLGEEPDSAITEAHGAWRETIAVFSMQQRVVQVLCCEEVGGFVVALSQQADLSDRGLLRTFALATALQSGDHVLAPWYHDRPPLWS